MKQTATIQIASDLALPLAAVTQTFAVLAKKGAGKTYTASVMAEEMLSAGEVVVAIDPTGAWWGLRASADGKREGFPVVVFGGDRADVPLNPLAGELVARAVVSKRFPAVIDLSTLRKGDANRFVTAFLETLYRENREPLHLFVDEADDVCPQRPFGDESRMVGAVEDVVKRGRKKGIGCTLITQRPADLNKQVLTQCEVLIALNVSHPKDITPIEEWVRVHADDAAARKMIADLPTLPKGEGWIWSPSWLNVFRRVKVRKRHTFDSGATPEVGVTRSEPKKLAAVDVAALGEQMAALVEEAKANDPKELKRRVAELDKQLREKVGEVKTERVEVPVITPDQERLIAEALAGFREAVESVSRALLVVDQARKRAVNVPTANRTATAMATPVSRPVATAKVGPAEPLSEGLTGPQQAILDAILMLDTRGIPATRESVARWLDIHPNGGSYGTNLGLLRSQGYLDGFRLSAKGRGAARPRPTGIEAAIVALPDEPKRKIVRTLIEAGRPLTRDELAGLLGIHPNGGSYGTNLGRLRTMGLVTERGPIALTEGAYR